MLGGDEGIHRIPHPTPVPDGRQRGLDRLAESPVLACLGQVDPVRRRLTVRHSGLDPLRELSDGVVRQLLSLERHTRLDDMRHQLVQPRVFRLPEDDHRPMLAALQQAFTRGKIQPILLDRLVMTRQAVCLQDRQNAFAVERGRILRHGTASANQEQTGTPAEHG